ncbi:hypothetical protein TCAL_15239 [Tigriopus californicus]|uniref:3'-5' exonuclease domain-containing protein n=1 Tax=Tigriopus californicus TaxID=6832 RepID=A0A553NFQ4_TIGCA|nr:hypothetical protein TCAL_15239 [Tigriopus californicus]
MGGSHFKIDRRRDLNTHLTQLHHVDMATVLTQRQLEPPEKLVEFHLQDFHPFQMPKYSQISCHMEGDKFAHRFLIEFGRIREDFWRDPDTPPELMWVPRKFYFIDRFAGGAFEFALDEINAVKLIGVSVQGHVSRGGALSTMSVSTKTHLFVFDLSLLGLDAIIHRGLGDILASPVIMKVIHDVRFLSDFLHHECQVTLSNVYDTLAAHSLFMTWRVYAGYMPKFASTYNELAKAYFGLDANSLHFRHVRSISPEEDLKIWFQRPLEDHLLQGAVRQTMFLLDLQRATRECMNAPFIWATEALMSTVRDSDDMEAEVQKTEAQVLPRSVLKVLPRLEPG